jgi:hypothetical protein
MEAIPEDEEDQRRSVKEMRFKNSLHPAPTASTIGPTKLISNNTSEPPDFVANVVNFESGDAKRKDTNALKGSNFGRLRSPSK